MSEFEGLLPPVSGEVAVRVRDAEVVRVLPADIVEVWGDSEFARLAVADWGLEVFRSSVPHQVALADRRRVPKAGLLARKALEDPKKGAKR